MARPKRGKTKEKLTLSISEEHKYYLNSIANYRKQSISQLVEEMAVKEYQKDCKRKGKGFEPYETKQIRLDDV
ncbi:MAG: hypothetical protein R3Y63_13260 [Eubacteriales bacterium]